MVNEVDTFLKLHKIYFGWGLCPLYAVFVGKLKAVAHYLEATLHQSLFHQVVVVTLSYKAFVDGLSV
jgi:hypothetical protein